MHPDKKPSSSEEVYIINKKNTGDTSYIYRIKIGDRITIQFLNNYDLTKTSFSLDESSNGTDAGYVIDREGFVNLPLIGKVQLIGLSREEAARKLEKSYATVLNNPIIKLSIVNIKVNLLGEVGRQGKYLIDREGMTLVDLITEAGGFTNRAKKKAVRIIRGDPRNPEVIIVNLRKVGILRYQEIKMQDNDIVVVDPARIYELTDPLQASGVALQPFLFIVNTFAILYSVTK